MEKIKIFATPEAYKILTDSETGETSKAVIQDIFDQIANKTTKQNDSYHEKSKFGVSIIWAKWSFQTSVALIYHSEKLLGIGYVLKPEIFWADVSTAIPVDFI